MNITRILLVTLVLCILGASVAFSTDVTPTIEENRIIELTNSERVKNGLIALAFNSMLTKCARLHSLNMAHEETLAHTLNGSTMTQRIQDTGYSYLSIGENIAFNQQSPEEVVDSWMKSPGHRANILNKDYTEIGVGVQRDTKNQPYYTQDFARPSTAGPTFTARFSILNSTSSSITVVLAGSSGKSMIEPGTKETMSVAGTGEIPVVEIIHDGVTKKLAFENGADYTVRSVATDIEVVSSSQPADKK